MNMADRKRKYHPECEDEHSDSKHLARFVTSSSSKGTSAESSKKEGDTNVKFFSSFKIYVLPTGIGKARCDIFKRNIEGYGGKFVRNFNTDDVTHIVVDDVLEYDRILKILKVTELAENVIIVKSKWLSACIKEKQLQDTKTFRLMKPEKTPVKEDFENNLTETSSAAPVSTSSPGTSKVVMRASDSDYTDSGEEKDGDESNDKSATNVEYNKKRVSATSWVCAHSSTVERPNYNQAVTDKLQALANIYQSNNDKWRALGYTKAVAAIRRHPKPITSYEEAVNIRGVGTKLANKVWEIIESGELRKLCELSSTEENQALELFTNIWGVGASTARSWVQLGYRTLKDVEEKAKLSKNQVIGLKYYDEFIDRMPHEEAGEIEDVVRSTALSLVSGLIVQACGSYRRGKATCGDVDVLVTHPDNKSHEGLYARLLRKLHDIGFLTDDLVSHEDNGRQQKYLGVCMLPGENRKHRRLDIIVVPYDEYACALMYFTGSAHFNRSMRNLASKMSMSLSEHSLNVGVVRKNGEKINKGTPVPTPTEESVFEHLGLPYRPPHERNH